MINTKKELISSITNEINYYNNAKIRLNPPYCLGEKERLDLIDLYNLSLFRDISVDALGQQMVFYNISSFPVEVASKMLDFDTKDFLFIDESGNYWETWFFEKEFRQWVSEKYFGRILNQFAYNYPKDGHLVAKKVDDDVLLVPLKNLRFRPDVDNFNQTPIVERHEYSPDEFLAEAKKRGWDNYQDVSLTPAKADVLFDKNDQFSSNKLVVYEFYIPKTMTDGDNWFLVSYDGIVLATARQDDLYKDLAWDKVYGRLLGRGQVEKLFNEQIYLNRIANYKAEGLHWTSKHLFQTRDTSMNTNLLGGSENGDVFIVNDPLTPIPVEERNLSFYRYDEDRWERHAFRRAFTTEPITGERAPSGTPLGSSILQARMTSGFYDQKKENLAMFLKEIIWDWVLPEFKKNKRNKHEIIMRNIMSSDKGGEKFFQMHLNQKLNKEKIKKFYPPDVWQIKKALLAEKLKSAKIEVPKGIYDNLKYKMKIVIQGESIDTASKLTTLQTLFQIIGSNPTVIQDPTVKDILFKMLNLAGFNPMDFEMRDEVPSLQEASIRSQAVRGGSIARPETPAVPTALPQAAAV